MESNISNSNKQPENTEKKATNIDKNPTSSYFEERMKLLGITSEINKIGLRQTDPETGKEIIVDFPIFSTVPEGIKIIVYTISRYKIRAFPKETIDQETGHGVYREGRWKKDFYIIRLEKPIERQDGSVMKYRLPKGAGTHPFFPPALVHKFDEKKNIDTLYCVEGYFKAFKASMEGVDIIGLSSITHMKDKETGKLHSDIITLISVCNVKRIVWLTDGDALDITQHELKDAKDLSIRPKNFFFSVTTFNTLLSDFEHLEKWFFHIDTDNILAFNPGTLREDVKGLDDLLISLHTKKREIISDLKSLNTGPYFQKFNISYDYGIDKIRRHFHLHDVDDFYRFHVDKRPELKNAEFTFNGTKYQYNEKDDTCEVKIPGEAKLYLRVGDDYLKFVSVPDLHGKGELQLKGIHKSTIIDDHGRTFIKHIPKYEAFCNVPNHFNYQQVINNCFNLYSPLDFAPLEEVCTVYDCPTIIEFLSHLFGETPASYEDPDTNEKKVIKTLDIALDYVQLLYLKPQQKLPILCLVSKENNTGKSSFADFLRTMLGLNVAIVGNADLAGDFNIHWATKSVVICDETKIDKENVLQKIKSLSTGNKVFVNAKGRAHVEIDCFSKFILITNNEETFVNASNEDIRYWVNKVPVLGKVNTEIMNTIKDEMPAFLSFLNNRKLVTEKKNRMWFHPELLKTDALKRVIDSSRPTAEKEIRHYLKEVFLDNPQEKVIEMPLLDIQQQIFSNHRNMNGPYLKKILQDYMNVFPYHVWTIDEEGEEYETKNEALAAAKKRFPELKEDIIINKIKPKYKPKRYTYLKRTGDYDNPYLLITPLNPGRPYCFKRSSFVDNDE